jgi:hypothetical protein
MLFVTPAENRIQDSIGQIFINHRLPFFPGMPNKFCSKECGLRELRNPEIVDGA